MFISDINLSSHSLQEISLKISVEYGPHFTLLFAIDTYRPHTFYSLFTGIPLAKIFSLGLLYVLYYMSHVTRKPVLCHIRTIKCRSACRSAQPDQRLCFHCLESITSIVAISKSSGLYLASVPEQTGLSL